MSGAANFRNGATARGGVDKLPVEYAVNARPI